MVDGTTRRHFFENTVLFYLRLGPLVAAASRFLSHAADSDTAEQGGFNEASN